MRCLKITKSLILLFPIFLFLFSSCSDEEQPAQITVTANDFSVTLSERPENGQVLGTVIGATNEGEVTFSITEQSADGALIIDGSTGELKVANAALFDFNINPIITGTVKVANGNVFENALLMIYLTETPSNVFVGRAELKTQAEVDAFGANNYTHITGQLSIGNQFGLDYTDINDLSSLSSLTSIGENLFISYNEELANLNGLENLEYVGSHLHIENNPSLMSLAALNSLPTVTKLERPAVLANPQL